MIERGQVTKAETVCDSITGWSPHCHSTSNSHSLLNAYPVLFTALETSLSGWMLSLPLTSYESHDLLASNAFVKSLESYPLQGSRAEMKPAFYAYRFCFFGKRLKLLELPATSTHARGKMQVQSHTYI
ncbi:hypothetical protein GW17_00055930 [Ensete ventricosum]|uniref:Uncharacterized protein n=1 Tax=Ensete ventricosum TaxID=4639 RepID=A0A444C9J8_ENSVE|nr:hypothetical protein GW17_00055930 [Ensete ventricosum]RZR75492.1 hypothetical protein BHM03_00059259 [Ensete ventricosum]